MDSYLFFFILLTTLKISMYVLSSAIVETKGESNVETKVKTNVKTKVETNVKTKEKTNVKTKVETNVETKVETNAETNAETKITLPLQSNAISNNCIKVFWVILNLQKIVLEINDMSSSTTIADLINEINSRNNGPDGTSLMLVFNHKPLIDFKRTLKQCGIIEESNIYGVHIKVKPIPTLQRCNAGPPQHLQRYNAGPPQPLQRCNAEVLTNYSIQY